MTGAQLIECLRAAELKEPGIINREVLIHPHGTGYRQLCEHVYAIQINHSQNSIAIVLESKRD